MIGRRQPYKQGSGQHHLWLNVGGSAGHNGLYAIDIDEGAPESPDNRQWQVTVNGASEARAQAAEDAEETAERQANAKQSRDLAKHKQQLLNVLKTLPDGETTNGLRDFAGLSGKTARPALMELLSDGQIEQCTVTKNSREFDGFRLPGLTRTDPDSPGWSG